MLVHCLMHLWKLLRSYGNECGMEQNKHIPLLFIPDLKNMDEILFKTVVKDNYHWKKKKPFKRSEDKWMSVARHPYYAQCYLKRFYSY